MKKSLVATAVLLIIMSAASDAATVYDKDGTRSEERRVGKEC